MEKRINNIISTQGKEAWTTLQQIINYTAAHLCEDNLDPQLDQGNEEVIRVAVLTFYLRR